MFVSRWNDRSKAFWIKVITYKVVDWLVLTDPEINFQVYLLSKIALSKGLRFKVVNDQVLQIEMALKLDGRI